MPKKKWYKKLGVWDWIVIISFATLGIDFYAAYLITGSTVILKDMFFNALAIIVITIVFALIQRRLTKKRGKR